MIQARQQPDPVIEAYKKDVDRILIRENLKRSVEEDLDASPGCHLFRSAI
jgi:hypothetical protein